MNFSLILYQPNWQTVFKIPQGTTLQKGRHDLYQSITQSAASIDNKFGCYSWGSDAEIFYCGSFARDYKHGGFKTNLQARIHNYLQNHRRKDNGQMNTNLMVFEKINENLQSRDILLRIFKFESLQIGDDQIDYATFSANADLVHAVEELLICTYRRHNQCQWNRKLKVDRDQEAYSAPADR